MNEHTLRVLEYDKLITIAAGYAASAPGRAALSATLPAADSGTAGARLEETREFISILRSGESPPLDGIKDISAALERLGVAGAMLSPAELFDIASTLSSARRVKTFFKRFEGRGAETGVGSRLLCGRSEGIRPLKHLEDGIFRAIDEKGEVKDSASRELGRIRRQIGRTREDIIQRLSRIIQGGETHKVIQEPVITVRDDRYVLPLKPGFRQSLKGVVHGQSSSRATLFVEPLDVLDQNNRLSELRISEREEVERILRELTGALYVEFGTLRENFGTVTHIDAVYGRARFGVEFGCSVPEISSEGRIRLRGARHPLLLWRTPAHSEGRGREIIPCDIEIGGPNLILIISGPNAGGKTVVLKTIGLLCLMAQAGLPVTAAGGSELPVFGSVFADIGDEQSLEQSLSTFSSHAGRIADILRDAGKDTLVLLDELGTGTDPAEGAALGAAVLERLLERGCVTITTTHHNILKLFGAETDGVMNAAMEFDPRTLMPTYRFIPGRPGRSYGLSMAARLGVPQGVVERAAEKLGKDDARLEGLLEKLEIESRGMESQKRLLAAELDAARQARAEAEASLRSAREEARSIAQRGRGEIREVLSALKLKLKELSSAHTVEQAEAKKIGAEIETQSRRIFALEQEQPPVSNAAVTNFTSGRRVRMPRLGKTGTVLASHKGMIEIEAGGIRLKVPADEVAPLENVSQAAPDSTPPGWSAGLSDDEELPLRLNILGMRVDEAIAEVERHIDMAAVRGRSVITIVHGLGTGALKTAVAALLKTHPLIAATRPGDPAEGGAGATVAELRK